MLFGRYFENLILFECNFCDPPIKRYKTAFIKRITSERGEREGRMGGNWFSESSRKDTRPKVGCRVYRDSVISAYMYKLVMHGVIQE